MRLLASRPLSLFPLVTAAALALAAPAAADDGIVWRTDYTAARKEAAQKGLPLFIVVSTDNCFYCRKLEGGPLRDVGVVGQLRDNFIPLKLDGNRDANLAKALRIQLYPTIVLAGPDGKIHAFIEGYLEADRLNDQLKRAVTATTTADWAARDFEQATKALAASEYPRAVTLLKGITREQGEKPIGVKSRQVLEDVERLAAGRLARAKELEQRGLTQEALDTLAEAVKTYAGTQAAGDAATLMTGLAAKPETQERLRGRAARDLLAAAREEFRTKQFYDCLQRCDQLAAGYHDLPEAKEAAGLAAEIKGNPERLAAVCDQMNQRTAGMYTTLAEAWVKKGQPAEAIACYEKVAKLCPNTRQADIALAEVTKLRANGNAVPTGGMRPQ
jgi:tetratricopeptide (TPR) repeat protein